MHLRRSIWQILLVFFILGVWPLGSVVLGAATADAGSTTDFIGDLWQKVQQAGPFASMLLIYFLWRSEKRSDRLQEERDGLLERVLNALHGATSTVEKLTLTLDRLLTQQQINKGG